jgi:hypothetical protein
MNRLSGVLPDSLVGVSDDWVGSVLLGNLFTFSLSADASNDKDSAIQLKGSFQLNVALLLSSPLVLAVLGVCCVWSTTRDGLSVGSTCRCQLPDELRSAEAIQLLLPVLGSLWITCWLQCVVVGAILLLFKLLPPLAARYPAYEFQYGWVCSIAYLHGIAPLVVVCVVVGYVCGHVVKSIDGIATSLFTPAPFVLPTNKASKLVGAFVANMVVMLVINGLYLQAVVGNSPDLIAVQVGLALCKLVWSNTATKLLFKFVKIEMNKRFFFRYSLFVFNLIVAPCIATALSDNSCFYELFQRQPAPSSTVSFCPQEEREYEAGSDPLDDYTCLISPSLESVSLTPPFMYSFQCGSALIANYVPVLLYSFLFSGLLAPLLVWTALRWRDGLPAASPLEAVPGWLGRLLPAVVLTERPIRPDKHLFNSVDVLCKLFLNLTVFFTFGSAFPYLGAVVLCASVSEVGLYLLLITRLRAACSVDRVQDVNTALEFTMKLCNVNVRFSMLLLVVVVVWFWALLSFDMIADLYGTSAGLVALGSGTVTFMLFIFSIVAIKMRNSVSTHQQAVDDRVVNPIVEKDSEMFHEL